MIITRRILPLEHRIKQAILELGAIRYVPIRGEEGFFVIKYPGTYLEWGQDLGGSYHRIRAPWLDNAPLVHNVPDEPINYCCILYKSDKDKYEDFILRKSSHGVVVKKELKKAGFKADAILDFLAQYEDDVKIISETEVHLVTIDVDWQFKSELMEAFSTDGKKIISFLANAPRGEVDDNYLERYANQIRKAPEFQLESMFTAKFKLVDESYYGFSFSEGSSDSTEKKYTDVDKLIPREGVVFPKHWKPINDLLRYIGLLDDGRGKGRELDETSIAIRDFIKEKIKANIGKKEKLIPSKLKAEYDKHLREEFTPIEDEYELSGDKGKEAEEKIKRYQRDVETIRGILKSLMKK